MIWFKSAIAGLAAALITILLIVVVTSSATMSIGAGGGGIGAVSFDVSELLLIPFVLAFVLGFRWMFRPQRRRLGMRAGRAF